MKVVTECVFYHPVMRGLRNWLLQEAEQFQRRDFLGLQEMKSGQHLCPSSSLQDKGGHSKANPPGIPRCHSLDPNSFFPPVLLRNNWHISLHKFKAYIEHDDLISIYCKMITTVGSADIHLLIYRQQKRKERKIEKKIFSDVENSYDLLLPSVLLKL